MNWPSIFSAAERLLWRSRCGRPRHRLSRWPSRWRPHSEYRAEQVLEEVEDAVRGWFTGQRLGHDVLLAQLGSLIYGCDGVANYAILSPTADVEVEQDVLPVLDTLTVEEMP